MGRSIRNQIIMRTIETSQFVNWVCKKYFRFLFLGALTSCAVFNMALHSAAGLHYYCQYECMEEFILRPLGALDPIVVEHIKDNFVDPPFPRGNYKHDFSLENPPWEKLGKWGEANKFVMNYFKSYKDPGKFVEVGAQDGEFMSFTLWLEQEKGFEGLLIEPNPVDYPKLRARKRSAFSINACASTMQSHHKDILWLRDIPENLPPLLKRVQEGSNRLIQYVTSEDRELGSEYTVQCFNVAAMTKAALNSLVIDFVSVSTHGGEIDILLNLPLTLHIRMLLVIVPLATPNEFQDIKDLTQRRGLVEALKVGNIHIFVPKEEVVFQR